ncbi:MAG: nicotinate (nicotinamide) nucleotide adenylyltransferase [Clostridium sp.]|nr:nicotinate (nicotinamide) nucleotide adenylyltransferase [Clostridium sp.]MCM1171898.1 nicotinate (nicotinamide) nucleotide adenylyltransferase [Clostridium sp.]MCM1209116.1 nicotinate (nicotinamide) nucleotide adenylyltransferase [Ruminococcus sp.]
MDNIFLSSNCIGIYGGTFNPLHNGHVMVIEEAIRQYGDIEKIVLMPNHAPAYKESRYIASPDDRIAMLKLMAKDNPKLAISDMEIRRGGYTYTYDTLEEITRQNPKLAIYFIIGSDSFLSINKWYKYEEILRMCTLLVAQREDSLAKINGFQDKLVKDISYARVCFLKVKPYEAASSDIRKSISEGKFPDDIMPAVIVKYIKENKLYGCE